MCYNNQAEFPRARVQAAFFTKFFIRVNIALYKLSFLVYINVVRHGGVAQLGERTVRIRKVESSILFVSTTSEQALYRLLRLILLVRARSCRCSSFPNRTRCAGLRFGVGCRIENCGIYSVAMLQQEEPHRWVWFFLLVEFYPFLRNG